MKSKITAFVNVLFVLAAGAGEFWVHNQTGDDAAAGSETAPFQTIERGFKALRPGDTLHVLPGDTPYPGDVRMENIHGTAEAPIVIDGHGSIVSGWKRLPAEMWTDEGGGVFSRRLPNNAWGMEKHWEGGFDLVHIDGKPGRNVASRTELAPGSYLLYKNRKQQKDDPLHNTLFICLPEGKTPDDLVVEGIAHRGGIYIAGNFVTVRNFVTEFGGSDGYATHRNRGVIFENIEARYFMDQGMSHHGAEVVVRNAHFHHNAGGGIVDVYPEAVVRYENCLVEADTWRGGVEFHSGRYEMVSCIIRNNAAKALTVTRGARVTLRNCLLSGDNQGAQVGDDASELRLENCTLEGFKTGLGATFFGGTKLTIENCVFRDCSTNASLTTMQRAKDEEPVDLRQSLKATGNQFAPSPWRISVKQETSEGKWKVADHAIAADDHEALSKWLGPDAVSTPEATETAGAALPVNFEVGPVQRRTP